MSQSTNAETQWMTRVYGSTLDEIVEQAEAEIKRFFRVSNIDWYDLDIRPYHLDISETRYEADVTVRLPG